MPSTGIEITARTAVNAVASTGCVVYIQFIVDPIGLVYGRKK